LAILVAGGAGYIGSHMTKLLLEAGEEVVVLDDLSSGHRDAVVGGKFILGNIGDFAFVDKALSENKINAVMHFASHIQVGESVVEPSKYYLNNVSNTLVLLDAMRKNGVRQFVFSSTAAVYGEPEVIPIPETHPKRPTNPYGRSKQQVEQILPDFDAAYGMKSVCLRYFNASGADPGGQLGERHEPETHLIPLVLRAAAGRSAGVQVFGDDYPTPDGTCIRDYIHVNDLCQAHFDALTYLRDENTSDAFNLGTGIGYSVRQIIETAQTVTKTKIPVSIAARRSGDPAVLVADSAKAYRDLGWRPARSDLENIIRDAWAWENNLSFQKSVVANIHK